MDVNDPHIGETWNRLTILEFDHADKHNNRYYKCECSCKDHTIITTTYNSLRSGHTKSCGCIKREAAEATINSHIDERWGKLRIDSFSHRDKKGRNIYYNCICDCGNTKVVRYNHLVDGSIVSCGCRQQEILDDLHTAEDPNIHIGEEYGYLKIIAFDHKDKNNNRYYKCRCRCGNITTPQYNALKSGFVVSCGCYRLEQSLKANTTHGLTNHRLYWIILDFTRNETEML